MLRATIICAVDDELIDPTRWFRSLFNQNVPSSSYEALIVDAFHNTAHREEFERYKRGNPATANVEYHRIEPGGRAKSLNYGIARARSNLIIFLGDDCQAQLDFVQRHLDFHNAHPEPSAVAIGPALFPPELRTPFTDWLEKSGRLWGIPFDESMATIPADFFYVANASVKRALIDQAGRFDERYQDHAWDDFEFGRRLTAAGMHTHLLPECLVWHLHDINLGTREHAMRVAGAAAKAYFASRDGERGWPESFGAKLHWARRAFSNARLRARPNDRAFQYWWSVRLDAAFADGYRNGRPRQKPA